MMLLCFQPCCQFVHYPPRGRVYSVFSFLFLSFALLSVWCKRNVVQGPIRDPLWSCLTMSRFLRILLFSGERPREFLEKEENKGWIMMIKMGQ